MTTYVKLERHVGESLKMLKTSLVVEQSPKDSHLVRIGVWHNGVTEERPARMALTVAQASEVINGLVQFIAEQAGQNDVDDDC